MSLVNTAELHDLLSAAKKAVITANFAQRIIPLLDLTNLNENATLEDVTQLCQDANTPLGKTAAVCIYPPFIKPARKILLDSSIKIATVANFPAGSVNIDATLATIHTAIKDGAQEIDVVMPYSAYLAGDQMIITSFTEACKKTCGDNILLKVILETGALQKFETMYAASSALINAGADFIKSSTGKIATGCTLEAAAAMLFAIKDSGLSIGFKAAGGVRTPEQAASYLFLIEQIVGNAWLTPNKTRIGASSLLQELLMPAKALI